MSNSSVLGAVVCADEASWGESGSFDERLPIISPVDVSGLEQSMVNVDTVSQYMADGGLEMRGVQGGSFTIEMYLCGHGSATSGAISASNTETFLSRVIGAINVSNDGGTVASSPTDADTFGASGATIANGSIVRVGAIGDARGGGQYAAVSNGSTVQLLTALGATPNASDVIYTPVQIYPVEDPTGSSVTSMRFEILTANQRYTCNGCYPQSISIGGLSPGEVPTVSVTMGVSKWSVTTGTFPTAVAVTSHIPSPVAGGSFFLQTFGTPTRATYEIREFNLNIDMATVPLLGPGATSGHQVIIGARRTRCQASFDFVVDSHASGTTTFDTLWNTAEGSASFKHALYTCSSARDSATIGIYFAKCAITASRPTQFDMDGVNRQRIACKAVTSSATSTALERANFILGMG